MPVAVPDSLNLVGHQLELVSDRGDFEFFHISFFIEHFDRVDLPINHMVRKNAAVALQGGIAMKLDGAEIEVLGGDFDFF